MISRENNNNVSRVNRKEIGGLGESIAANYLRNKGFLVIERNFLKKYGEIDLILLKERKLYFVEVKTVTCKIGDSKSGVVSRVPEGLMPEDNVHVKKLTRLGRTISSYIFKYPENQDWQFDVVAVFIDQESKRAVVRRIENVLLSL